MIHAALSSNQQDGQLQYRGHALLAQMRSMRRLSVLERVQDEAEKQVCFFFSIVGSKFRLILVAVGVTAAVRRTLCRRNTATHDVECSSYFYAMYGLKRAASALLVRMRRQCGGAGRACKRSTPPHACRPLKLTSHWSLSTPRLPHSYCVRQSL